MSEIHCEQFLLVAHVEHDRALIAWGAFFLRDDDARAGEPWPHRFKLLDDDKLRKVKPDRTKGSIGSDTNSYGEAMVRVGEVIDSSRPFSGYYVDSGDADDTAVRWSDWRNADGHTWSWVSGLKPTTRYRYQVKFGESQWGSATSEIRTDPQHPNKGTFWPATRHRRHEFVTFPAPNEPSGEFSFAVLGDPGTAEPAQFAVAKVLAERVESDGLRFVLTTGDNIYARGGTFWKIIRTLVGDERSSGDEDDDWFASFFLPYRDVISRVPVYPTIGNHDSENTEKDDDLSQMVDNFYLAERFRSSYAPMWEIGNKKRDAIFYRFRYGRDAEFVAVDTSFTDRGDGLGKLVAVVKGKRDPPIMSPAHRMFIDGMTTDSSPRWRIPFGHHPPFCVGPQHSDTPLVQELATQLRNDAGVRVWLSGHEHNFQHHRNDGVHYLLTGAAGKCSKLQEEQFAKLRKRPEARYCCFVCAPHVMIARIDEARLEVRLYDREGSPALVSSLPSTGSAAHPRDVIEILAT